jgi:hypothetical protein
VETIEAELGLGETGLKQIEIGVDAGIGTIRFDADKMCGEILLLARGGNFGADCVHFNVGGGSVESYLFASVFEGEVCGLDAGVGGLGVLALRSTEHQRLHGGAGDRGLACGEAMGVSDLGADGQGGYIDEFGLIEGGLSFLNVGSSEADGGGVALG